MWIYVKFSELGCILNVMAEKHHCIINLAGNLFVLVVHYILQSIAMLDLMKYSNFDGNAARFCYT